MGFDLEEELIKRNINVRQILEDYGNGQMFSIICKNHKITPEQLRFILRYNITEEINNKRKSKIESKENKMEEFKKIVSLVENGDGKASNPSKKNNNICFVEGKGFIDISEIIEKYKTGRGIERIMTMFRLNPDQLNKIIAENVTFEMRKERAENRRRFAEFGSIGKTKQNNLTADEARENVRKAIDLVEGNEK